MENYQSNSYKKKNEAKKEIKIEKVVKGTVKTKKKSEVRKFADNIISEDASKVKEYVMLDVLIPAVKKAISDIITNGIDIILYGETGHSKRTGATTSNLSYRYDKVTTDRRNYKPMSYRGAYSCDEIILETRNEAETVLMQMDEIVETYGFVKVADLYDLLGITGSYTDNNYGWTDIRSTDIVRVRDGWLLKLPKVMPID